MIKTFATSLRWRGEWFQIVSKLAQLRYQSLLGDMGLSIHLF